MCKRYNNLEFSMELNWNKINVTQVSYENSISLSNQTHLSVRNIILNHWNNKYYVEEKTFHVYRCSFYFCITASANLTSLSPYGKQRWCRRWNMHTYVLSIYSRLEIAQLTALREQVQQAGHCIPQQYANKIFKHNASCGTWEYLQQRDSNPAHFNPPDNGKGMIE